MKVWILFTWLSAAMPGPGLFPYATKAECEQDARHYTRAVCVLVDVPRK